MFLIKSEAYAANDAELARVEGMSVPPNTEVVLASTPGVRRLLNSPEVCGNEFQSKLSESLQSTLRQLVAASDLSRLSHEMDSAPIDVIYILRGGLNFDLHYCLSMLTARDCEVSFVSSQRTTDDYGTGFKITEDGYRKWNLHDNGIIFIGDIVATGTTVARVLNEIGNIYEGQGKGPNWLVIVTIGTMQCLEVLSDALNRLSRRLKFKGATIIFLEQMFNLYDGKMPLLSNTHLPMTDFFRNFFPRAVAFERESLKNPICLVERCAIYDGGSRSFEPRTYLNNLELYWTRLREFSHESLMELLALKSDLFDCRLSFEAWMTKRQWWSKEDDLARLRELYDLGAAALSFFENASVSEICERRLEEIRGH